jgi:large subunit ribosomal protein L10
MVQKWKIEEINKLKEELKEYQDFIFTDYRGLKVEQINRLRNTLRRKGAQFHVVKNRFTKRAFQELGFNDFAQFLVNPTAIAYSNDEISDMAKILIDSQKDTTLKLKGGYMDGLILSSEEIAKIAELPSKEVLIAQTLWALNRPIAGFVFVLSGILSGFVRTLKAIENIKSE